MTTTSEELRLTSAEKPFCVYITPKANAKIRAYTDAADGEVMSFLSVSKVKGGFLVEDAMLIEQEAGGAHVNIDQAGMAAFAKQVLRQDKRLFEKLAGWHHSHVNMGCFWSTTDSDNFATMGNGNPFFLGIVTTKDGNAKCRVDVKLAVSNIRITFDDLPLIVQYPQDKGLVDACVKEVKDKVKAPATPAYTNYGSGVWPSTGYWKNGEWKEYQPPVKSYSDGEWDDDAYPSPFNRKARPYKVEEEGFYLDFNELALELRDAARKEIEDVMRYENCSQLMAEKQYVEEELFAGRSLPLNAAYAKQKEAELEGGKKSDKVAKAQ